MEQLEDIEEIEIKHPLAIPQINYWLAKLMGLT